MMDVKSINKLSLLNIYGIVIAVLIGLAVLVGIFQAPHFLGTPEALPTALGEKPTGELAGDASFITPEIPAPGPPPPRLEEFEREFNRGVTLINQGDFHQASNAFHYADSINPGDPRVLYYLMICYEKIEKAPYEKGSYTQALARRLLDISPVGSASLKAQSIIDKSKNISTPKKTKTKTAALTGKKAPARPVIKMKPPVILPASVYPMAGPPVRIAGMTVRDIHDPPKKSKTKEKEPESPPPPIDTVTLEGSITRQDEGGRVFYPDGVQLTLLPLNGWWKYETQSDENGNYRFTGVKPVGNYVLVGLSRYTYTRQVNEFYQYYPCRSYYSPYQNAIPPASGPKPPHHGGHHDGHHPGPPPPHRPPGSTGIPGQIYGGITGSATFVENNQGRIGIGPFNLKNTQFRIESGYYDYRSIGYHASPGSTVSFSSGNNVLPYGTFYYGTSYYGPFGAYSGGYYYPYGAYNYSRSVDVDFNISWHLRMDLKNPGIYNVSLTPSNADSQYISDIDPVYDTATRQPYREIFDVIPVRDDGE